MYIFSNRLYSEPFSFNFEEPRYCLEFSIRVELELRYLHERAYWVGVYTQKQNRRGHCIFFLTDYIQRNFAFNIVVPGKYLDFFFIHVNSYFGIIHERAYWVGVYTPKQSRIGQCIFSLTQYIQSHFLLTLGRLDTI